MKKIGIKFCLSFVIILSPLAKYSFANKPGAGPVSVEAQVGARAYTDTMAMCKTLLDQRLPKTTQLDAANQNHGHLPVVELALKDPGFRGGLKNLADYSIAISSNVATNGLVVGVAMDESNKILQTRTHKLNVLLKSRGYQKAIDDCARTYNVPPAELDQLIRSVLGDVDTATLVTSRVASFIVTAYIFKAALDLLSRTLNLGCEHWFNKRRGLVMAGLGVALIGGAVGYGMIINEDMERAADAINEEGVGSLVESLQETRVSTNLTQDLQNYVSLVESYHLFAQSQDMGVYKENLPPELLAQLDYFMAKRPVIEQQLDDVRALESITPEEQKYISMTESMLKLVSTHEEFWKLWLAENSGASLERKLMVEAILEHQAILAKPNEDRSSQDFLRLDELREQMRRYKYE